MSEGQFIPTAPSVVGDEELAWTLYFPNSNVCGHPQCEGVADHLIVQVSSDNGASMEVRVNPACTIHMNEIKEGRH